MHNEFCNSLIPTLYKTHILSKSKTRLKTCFNHGFANNTNQSSNTLVPKYLKPNRKLFTECVKNRLKNKLNSIVKLMNSIKKCSETHK